MKTAEEYIKEVIVNDANFEHIAKTGRINGTLYVSLKELFKQAQSEAIDETVNACAEAARCIKTGNTGSWMDASVDQKSILKVAEQLKAKL